MYVPVAIGVEVSKLLASTLHNILVLYFSSNSYDDAFISTVVIPVYTIYKAARALMREDSSIVYAQITDVLKSDKPNSITVTMSIYVTDELLTRILRYALRKLIATEYKEYKSYLNKIGKALRILATKKKVFVYCDNERYVIENEYLANRLDDAARSIIAKRAKIRRCLREKAKSIQRRFTTHVLKAVSSIKRNVNVELTVNAE